MTQNFKKVILDNNEYLKGDSEAVKITRNFLETKYAQSVKQYNGNKERAYDHFNTTVILKEFLNLVEKNIDFIPHNLDKKTIKELRSLSSTLLRLTNEHFWKTK